MNAAEHAVTNHVQSQLLCLPHAQSAMPFDDSVFDPYL
jgi:hypothetical protein